MGKDELLEEQLTTLFNHYGWSMHPRLIDLLQEAKGIKQPVQQVTTEDLRRELEQLQLQAARFGIDTPPHVTNRIRDIERILDPNPMKSVPQVQSPQGYVSNSAQKSVDSLVSRLNIGRENLAHYLRQASTFGSAYVPPVVSHGINDARSEIARIKRDLREYGVEVYDHPDDVQQI